MSEIFIFQNKFHNFFSLKNQLKKHVVSYFCTLQLQYTNKRDSYPYHYNFSYFFFTLCLYFS
jgi:hypothetical protein